MLDPSIWDDEGAGSLSSGAFRTFIACISNADDGGKLEASPRRIRALAFRFCDEVTGDDVENYLAEIDAKVRAFLRYVVDGREYVKLVNWERYQKINRPSNPKSVLPDPPDMTIHGVFSEDSVSSTGPLTPNVSQCNVSKYSVDQCNSDQDVSAIARLWESLTGRPIYQGLAPDTTRTTIRSWIDGVGMEGTKQFVRDCVERCVKANTKNGKQGRPPGSFKYVLTIAENNPIEAGPPKPDTVNVNGREWDRLCWRTHVTSAAEEWRCDKAEAEERLKAGEIL